MNVGRILNSVLNPVQSAKDWNNAFKGDRNELGQRAFQWIGTIAPNDEGTKFRDTFSFAGMHLRAWNGWGSTEIHGYMDMHKPALNADRKAAALERKEERKEREADALFVRIRQRQFFEARQNSSPLLQLNQARPFRGGKTTLG